MGKANVGGTGDFMRLQRHAAQYVPKLLEIKILNTVANEKRIL
jgi:hypothetical protein